MSTTTRKKIEVADEDAIAFHSDPNLPMISLAEGTKPATAINVLLKYQESMETITQTYRIYKNRPDDGAYSNHFVMKKCFGITVGHMRQTPFGTEPAKSRTIIIGRKANGEPQTMQVPWGEIEVPVLPGLILNIGEIEDVDYGDVFYVVATGPRKHMAEVEAYLDELGEYVATHSIYKGRAMIGSNKLEFLDVDSFDRTSIVFTQEVEDVIDGYVLAPIKYADRFRKEGLRVGGTYLFEGPFGTGKTSLGLIVAQVSTLHGYTYIAARAGVDSPEQVLRTARLYAPAVVFIEDIDGAASVAEDDKVSRLLEMLDGQSTKADGKEIVTILTTNHIERIHKGVLRPGRLDGVVHVGALDRESVERLVKAVVNPGKLSPTVDYDQVYEATVGFLPAFIKETIHRAISFSINRLNGDVDYIIETPDLVGAANSLRPQLDLMNKAGEGERKPTLDIAIHDAVAASVTESVVGLGIERPGMGTFAVITAAE